MYVCMYVCIHVYVYVCMYVYIYMYVCMHVYVYVCMCMYVDSPGATNIGTLFCLSEGTGSFSRYFKISNFFMYVTISYRTPATFSGTMFGNFGLETRAVLFKTVFLYC